MTHTIISAALEQKNIQTTVKLQNLALPNIDICTVEELFLRTNQKCLINYDKNIVELKKGGFICFDTYFNSFSVQKWQKHTIVKTININLRFQGKFKVKLLNVNYFTDFVKIVDQKVITTQGLDEVEVFSNIEIQAYKGLLYVEFEALDNNCLFAGGCFHANVDISQQNNDKIAVVICTYKREAYVEKNIQILERYLFNKPDLGNKFEVFIIDNGRTLDNFTNSKVHLIPNKNTGGTGGFTRGILEVLERKSDFSHIIFMDDDVAIATEALERIYNFQRVSNDRNLCIGGSMLKLDHQFMQHENGAVWDDTIVRGKPDIDLRHVRNILFNEIEEHVNYNAWWLFCFPTNIVNDLTLPYPFFIRGDDIELSMRLKLKVINLNGICVWHESFETKFSPAPNYYARKNELILNCLYSENFSKMEAIKQIVKFTLREALCYKYKSANLILKAVSDFLQGPNYLKTTDPEAKNSEVLSMGEKAVKQPELPFLYAKYDLSLQEAEKTIHRLLRIVTLNGHLLPTFFFHKDNRLTKKGYKIAPMHGYRPINVFRVTQALYYNVATQEGFVVKFSRVDFFKTLLKTIFLSTALFFKFSRLKHLYRETLPELTNKAFWENYLEISKYSKNYKL